MASCLTLDTYILFKWTENCNIAFAKIEEFLTGPGIMAFRMSNEGFILKKLMLVVTTLELF